MPSLHVTNVGEATVVLKDSQGYSTFVMEIAKGATETADVTQDVLERVTPSLQALEVPILDSLNNVLAGIRWAALASSDIDDRAIAEGFAGLPSLIELQASSYDTVSGDTNVILTGTSLLGNQTKATLQIYNAAKTLRLDLEAVTPGAPGNDISCEIITPSATLDVSVSGNKVTIRPASGGSTVADIVTAINTDPDALLLVQAAVGTAGTINAAIAETKLKGGLGAGVSLTLNGTACSITAITDTTITFDVAAGISASGSIIPLEYRNGPHISRLSVPVTVGGVEPVPTYDNTTRPGAATVPAGTMIFNTDDGAPNWSTGAAWVNALGAPT